MLIRIGRNLVGVPAGLGEGEIAGSGVALLVTVYPKARPRPATKTRIDKTEKRMAEYASGTAPVCKSNLQAKFSRESPEETRILKEVTWTRVR
jgi:hypothetical protein